MREISLKISCFPAFFPRQQAGIAIRGLPDQLEMKSFKKSGTSEEPVYRLIRNWEDKMEIAAKIASSRSRFSRFLRSV